MCVFLLSPPQELSELELTLQKAQQNGTRPREVLLVLGANKNMLLRLQAPGIALNLAFVSVNLPPWAEALAMRGPCSVSLGARLSCPGSPASLFHSDIIHPAW